MTSQLAFITMSLKRRTTAVLLRAGLLFYVMNKTLIVKREMFTFFYLLGLTETHALRCRMHKLVLNIEFSVLVINYLLFIRSGSLLLYQYLCLYIPVCVSETDSTILRHILVSHRNTLAAIFS